MNDRQYKDEENQIVKADNPIAKFDDKQIQLIHDLYAKNTTKEEFELFMYTAGEFGLNPLLKQIWCVKFEKKDRNGNVVGYEPAQIYSGRDGFLEIAHRSGQFNGMESGTKYDEKGNLKGWCKVFRKDMDNPFYIEVDFTEYSTGKALWGSKPKTMISKVAESQCLRRAFRISGVYSEDEMGQWELEAQGIKFNNEPVKQIANNSNTDNYDLDPETYTFSYGKFIGKKGYEADAHWLEWLIGQLKANPSKTTKEGYPNLIYADFLAVCLAIHNENNNKPAEPEYTDVEEVSQEELEADYEENIKYFEKKFDAVETPDSVMANLDKKLNVKR